MGTTQEASIQDEVQRTMLKLNGIRTEDRPSLTPRLQKLPLIPKLNMPLMMGTREPNNVPVAFTGTQLLASAIFMLNPEVQPCQMIPR